MLLRDIEEIRERLVSGFFPNEAAVSQGIVLRLLRRLGWPTDDVETVAPEYGDGLEGRRVDFALCHPPNKPAVFIEVKRPGQSKGKERQLFEYAFHTGVPMAILTDGRKWEFYLPGEQGDYRERQVAGLDLIQNEIAALADRLERYLAYSAICDGTAIAAARADYRDVAREREIQRALPEAWQKLVEEEDGILIGRLSDKVKELCGDRPEPELVVDFLKRQGSRTQPASIRTHGPAPAPPRRPVPVPRSPAPNGRRTPARKSMPSTGFGFRLEGQEVFCRNGVDVLVAVFEELEKRDPSILERFAALPKHGRTRRYVARSPEELYPGSPHLAPQHAHQLPSGWWLDKNHNPNGIRRVVRIACAVAGLRYGSDLAIRLGD